MNIIFLDIDGVLNYQIMKPGRNANDVYGLCDKHVALLKHVLDSVPYTRIVMSSAWRHMPTEPHVMNGNVPWRRVLEKKLAHGNVLLGDTPRSSNGDRGSEILAWIEDHGWQYGMKNFAIVDDDVFDIVPYETLKKHVVKTRPDEGLVEANARKIIKLLKGEIE